jgi:homoserine dehydrogenase
MSAQERSALKVALVGFGTVGTSVARLLASAYLPGIRVAAVYNREVGRKIASDAAKFVPASARWTQNFDDVLTWDVDVVVELVGGAEPAGTWIEKALKAGKHVVTANKQLIAYRGPALAALAAQHRVQLLHGAAVAGGVPVIPGMLQGLSGDEVTRISGILNGTCNYILSRMERGDSYAGVLKDAQRLGYAEADPTADVGGFDARAKLCILARTAMHAELDPDQVPTQTIAAIDAIDFAYAKELGCTIRQVSKAQLLHGEAMYARVAPMLVPLDSPMAWSKGTQNMVVSTGRFGGDVVFSGHGAGGDATAVAVLSDLVAISQGARAVGLPVTPKTVTGDSVAPHYLRFVVNDKPGIVSAISGALSQVGANIDSLLQRRGYPKNRLPFVVTTEPTLNSTIAAAVESIATMDCMLERPLSLEMLVVDDKDEETA